MSMRRLFVLETDKVYAHDYICTCTLTKSGKVCLLWPDILIKQSYVQTHLYHKPQDTCTMSHTQHLCVVMGQVIVC